MDSGDWPCPCDCRSHLLFKQVILHGADWNQRKGRRPFNQEGRRRTRVSSPCSRSVFGEICIIHVHPIAVTFVITSDKEAENWTTFLLFGKRNYTCRERRWCDGRKEGGWLTHRGLDCSYRHCSNHGSLLHTVSKVIPLEDRGERR